MVRGFVLALALALAILGMVTLFDVVVDALSYAVLLLDTLSREVSGMPAADTRFAAFAASAVDSASYAIPIAVLAVLFVYAIHTRRR